MNVSKAFNKPFSDVKKLIIGIILSLFPIVRWFAKGYILEASDVRKKKSTSTMPEWKNLMQYFAKGFIATVISILYMVPAILLCFITAIGFVFYLVNFYVGTIIPQGTIESVVMGNATPEKLGLLIQQNWTPLIPAIINFTPIILLIGILTLLAYYLIPIATLNYIKTGKFEAAFRLRDVGRKAFTSSYFAVWLVATIVTILLTMLLVWIPVIGYGASFFIAGVFSYSLFGEVYKML